MARRINIFLFIALISIFQQTINLNIKTKEQKCAHVNFWCNLSLLQPCCDANNQCFQFSVGVSQCITKEPQEFKSKLIDSSCTVDRDCGQWLNAECSKDEQCVCKPKNIYRNNKCLPILGSFCWHNHQSCATLYSECISLKCQCKNGYSQFSSNQCMLNIIGENCDDDKFCSQVKFAKCTKSKKCDCSFNTIAIDKIRCLPILNGICFENAECFLQNSHCVDNKCQCTPGFTAVSNIKCIKIILGAPCKFHKDCHTIKNAKCSENNTCVCRTNYYVLDEFSCGPSINESCRDDDDCMIHSSVCIDNQCQCQKNFSAVSHLQCVKNDLLFSCEVHTDCGDPWHSKCLENKKCGCNTKSMLIDKSTCLPLIGGLCWADTQCITIINSSCVDYHCKCNSNTRLIADNMCQQNLFS